MKVLVLDLETTVEFIDEIDEETGKTKKSIDNSPFNPKNKIVSAHWRKVEYVDYGPYRLLDARHSVFHHNDYPFSDSRQELEEALEWADMMVAHNAKYDATYLLESGFKIPDNIYCTMVGEYILAKGTEVALSLEATAERREVAQKKLDTTKQYFKDGIGFDAMPLPIVIEYADADVLSTTQIYIQQMNDWTNPEHKSLNNIVTLMNEMLLFLVEIERNGIMIDTDRLNEIKADYITEREQLIKDLSTIAESVLGDEKFNLNSGADLSKIVYSREVFNKPLHMELFRLGTDRFGKKQYPPYMTQGIFNQTVRTTTKIVKKKSAKHCELCHGHGTIRKFKKNGDPFKNATKCSRCGGLGYTLDDTDAIAGLRLIPERPSDASAHGFSVSKDTFDRLIAQANVKGNLKAVEFLQKKKRLNAVNTYLNSFVEGIQRWVRADGLLHAGFNQTVAKTGRLSSSHPNFQNQPKEKKFPIRSCVVSRFKNGLITECDFAGLEFVVAGELSRDPQIIEDILSGKDIHGQTAAIVHQVKDPTINWKDDNHKNIRNEVKPYTFAPLYGGQGANEPDHIRKYFQEFYNIYNRHAEWQKEQMDHVVTDGYIQTPSGRQYTFPGTMRIKNGRTTNATAIVNYPVQGFATGDIVPLACIRAYREFRRRNLLSVLILTVHDSIVADTHPDETKEVYEILKWATEESPTEIKTRWDYDMVLPLKSEVSQGKNWMELKAIHE